MLSPTESNRRSSGSVGGCAASPVCLAFRHCSRAKSHRIDGILPVAAVVFSMPPLSFTPCLPLRCLALRAPSVGRPLPRRPATTRSNRFVSRTTSKTIDRGGGQVNVDGSRCTNAHAPHATWCLCHRLVSRLAHADAERVTSCRCHPLGQARARGYGTDDLLSLSPTRALARAVCARVLSEFGGPRAVTNNHASRYRCALCGCLPLCASA
jgi:hypothetical protein